MLRTLSHVALMKDFLRGVFKLNLVYFFFSSVINGPMLICLKDFKSSGGQALVSKLYYFHMEIQ